VVDNWCFFFLGGGGGGGASEIVYTIYGT